MSTEPEAPTDTLPARAASRNSLTTLSAEGGGIVFHTVAEARDIAYLMAGSDLAVRKHLRNNPGACFGIVIQAVEWGMSPYAVANKSYAVNDQLAYESQLIQAVILRRAPLKGRIKYAFDGDGDDRVCIASATTLDGETVEYKSPKFGKIQPKNSPLWKNDPDQQHSYFSGRGLCRRHFPDVLLGIYDVDEMVGAEPMRDVTPKPSGLAARLAGGTNGFNADAVSEALDQTEKRGVDWRNASEATDALKRGELPEGYKRRDDGVLVVPDEAFDGGFRGQSVIMAFADEIVTASGKVVKSKGTPERKADPEIVRAGAQAFSDGEERLAPLDFGPAEGKAWIEGYDAAKASAEAEQTQADA